MHSSVTSLAADPATSSTSSAARMRIASTLTRIENLGTTQEHGILLLIRMVTAMEDCTRPATPAAQKMCATGGRETATCMVTIMHTEGYLREPTAITGRLQSATLDGIQSRVVGTEGSLFLGKRRPAARPVLQAGLPLKQDPHPATCWLLCTLRPSYSGLPLRILARQPTTLGRLFLLVSALPWSVPRALTPCLSSNSCRSTQRLSPR